MKWYAFEVNSLPAIKNQGIQKGNLKFEQKNALPT